MKKFVLLLFTFLWFFTTQAQEKKSLEVGDNVLRVNVSRIFDINKRTAITNGIQISKWVTSNNFDVPISLRYSLSDKTDLFFSAGYSIPLNSNYYFPSDYFRSTETIFSEIGTNFNFYGNKNGIMSIRYEKPLQQNSFNQNSLISKDLKFNFGVSF